MLEVRKLRGLNENWSYEQSVDYPGRTWRGPDDTLLIVLRHPTSNYGGQVYLIQDSISLHLGSPSAEYRLLNLIEYASHLVYKKLRDDSWELPDCYVDKRSKETLLEWYNDRN